MTPESSAESGPSKRRPSTKTVTREEPTVKERMKRIWCSITERPSLLSNSSDSANDEGLYEGHGQYANPDGDPRLYAESRRRSRARNRTMNVTADEDEDVDTDTMNEKEQGPASRTVVDNDFSTWIDPTTGRLLHHEVSKDDTESIRSVRTSLDEKEGSNGHYGKLSKAADACHLSWMGTFLERVRYFLCMSFPEKVKERLYLKDVYFVQRQIALSACIFFVVMWILVCVTTPRPFDIYDYYAYIGIYGALTLPLLPIIFFNVNYRMPICYQIWLTIATWVLPDITLIKVKTCGVWEPGVRACDTRSFFIAFAAAIGQPVLALLALNQNRFCAILGAGQFFVLIAIFYFHQPETPTSFYRDAVYYIVFHVFILIIDAFLERRDRQMFELREQLKKQFKETQRAQMKEKRASDLNKRFISYIFHEVRVPLNTALLSVQNLEADGVFRDLPEGQEECVLGLSSSLALMEKVLNDVLSFNRMESGNFTQAKAPFDFHRQMVMCASSHHAQAQAKDLAMLTDLDKRIDELGGMLVGDEMRLRQVTCNLISNSLKFTSSGSITLRTRLVQPTNPAGTMLEDSPMPLTRSLPDVDGVVDIEQGQGHEDETPHPSTMPKRRARMAIIRIEVEDTGVGLRAADMEETRLFSPYVQTEIGRRQGGKGTGLGLAFVRQIVQLNKGRLGVNSEYGKGSTFWLELPFQIKRSSTSISTTGGSYPSTSTRTYVGSSTLSKDFGGGQIVDSVVTDAPGLMGMATATATSTNSTTDNALAQAAEIGSPAGHVREISAVSGSTMSDSTFLNSPITTTTIGTPCTPQQISEPMNVLIVDDDQLTRKLMAKMLSRMGHHVRTAKHGKEGLDMINEAYHNRIGSTATASADMDTEKVKVDIVFLDNQMPEMSGVEVTRSVRLSSNPVYIVGCTGNALKEDQEEYTAAGADQVLTKPIKQAALVQAIEYARRRLMVNGQA